MNAMKTTMNVMKISSIRLKHTLPDLPYDYNALEPVISAEIMQLHHKKHHMAYVNNLNAAQDRLYDAIQSSTHSLHFSLIFIIYFFFLSILRRYLDHNIVRTSSSLQWWRTSKPLYILAKLVAERRRRTRRRPFARNQ